MFYPEKFKKRCKEVYPWHEELHKFVESGDHIVGRILEDGLADQISYDDILNANSLDELKERAKKGKEKELLYEEWRKLNNANRFRIYKS